jgi:hypothetical protein
VISQDAEAHYSCPVSEVVPYTPEMEKADRAKSAEQGSNY